MDDRLGPLLDIVELNTVLMRNCCHGVTEEQAKHRLRDLGNPIGFLVAHLTDARHFLAEQIGHGLPNPLSEVLADARSVEDIDEMPTLADCLDAWDRISRHLLEALPGQSTADLNRPTKPTFPIRGDSRLAMIAFLAQHESYHLGQIAFLRRQLGYPAMTYDPA